MTLDEYKNFLTEKLAENYEITADGIYLEKKYDIIGFARENGTVKSEEICLVSFTQDENFVKDELDSLPQTMISGIRSFLKDKTTFFLRAFVMENVPFELIRLVRAYKFSKAIREQFWSYAESRIVLVDAKSSVVYTNLAAESKSSIFSVIRPAQNESENE
jgi:hypothetical protein